MKDVIISITGVQNYPQGTDDSVELVTEGSDYYVVRAADNSSRALRAGDEVIVQATGLYDGQLLEF